MRYPPLLGLILSSLVFLTPGPALAQTMIRQISSRQARGYQGAIPPTLILTPGYGVSISFIPTQEVIQKVWLDDPSQIGMDFDTGTTPEAMVIHLRRIAPIQFPYLLSSGGTTILTVITRTPDHRRHLYHFRLLLSTAAPEYLTVEITPDQSGPLPLNHQPLAVTIQAGLQVAEQRRQISRQQPLWQRVQHFLQLTQQGFPPEQAAQRAGITMQLVYKLAELGTH